MVRVLMVAYSCQPDSGSEDEVGWQLASRISRRHSVHLITRPKGREAIEKALAENPSLELTVEYHELWGLRRLKYLGLPVSNLRYWAWNHRLAGRVRQLEPAYDVVHHTTWVRNWMPSAAAGATSTPFVWGPVGAAERPSLALIRTLPAGAAVKEAVRHVGARLLRLDPLMRHTLHRVDAAVASSLDTAQWMEAEGIEVRIAPSVGYEPAEVTGRAGATEYDFVSVGRLLGWKGFHLGLEAFARLEDSSATYRIIGDGPDGARLRALASDLGIADRVTFSGQLSRDDVLTAIGRSSVLVHPSFHESGGFVVVEAVASGVPVVVLDIGGPPFLAGGGGLAVDPAPPSSVVDRLAAAMKQAIEERAALSELALERAQDLTWESIVDVYDSAYSEVAADSN